MLKRLFQLALLSLLTVVPIGASLPAIACDGAPPIEIPAGVANTGVEWNGSAVVSLKHPGPDSFLNVRSAPNTFSPIRGKLFHKTNVLTLRKHGNWYLIATFGEQAPIVGWVDGTFLTDFGAP